MPRYSFVFDGESISVSSITALSRILNVDELLITDALQYGRSHMIVRGVDVNVTETLEERRRSPLLRVLCTYGMSLHR